MRTIFKVWKESRMQLSERGKLAGGCPYIPQPRFTGVCGATVGCEGCGPLSLGAVRQCKGNGTAWGRAGVQGQSQHTRAARSAAVPVLPTTSLASYLGFNV